MDVINLAIAVAKYFPHAGTLTSFGDFSWPNGKPYYLLPHVGIVVLTLGAGVGTAQATVLDHLEMSCHYLRLDELLAALTVEQREEFFLGIAHG